MIEKIRSILEEKLRATSILIEDLSEQHAHHPGAQESGGGHYRVSVVSAAFEGKSPLQRQRMVYSLLEEELQTSIHALSLKCRTPKENEPA